MAILLVNRPVTKLECTPTVIGDNTRFSTLVSLSWMVPICLSWNVDFKISLFFPIPIFFVSIFVFTVFTNVG